MYTVFRVDYPFAKADFLKILYIRKRRRRTMTWRRTRRIRKRRKIKWLPCEICA
jgi:hypothetical protein